MKSRQKCYSRRELKARLTLHAAFGILECNVTLASSSSDRLPRDISTPLRPYAPFAFAE
jgi:hypothetical protein